MAFSLITDDSVLTWADGAISGAPLSAVRDAETEVEATPVVAGTPTGPWFEKGTPEHAWLVLRGRAPLAEVSGDPPTFGDLGDELTEVPSDATPDGAGGPGTQAPARSWIVMEALRVCGVPAEGFNETAVLLTEAFDDPYEP